MVIKINTKVAMPHHPGTDIHALGPRFGRRARVEPRTESQSHGAGMETKRYPSNARIECDLLHARALTQSALLQDPTRYPQEALAAKPFGWRRGSPGAPSAAPRGAPGR